MEKHLTLNVTFFALINVLSLQHPDITTSHHLFRVIMIRNGLNNQIVLNLIHLMQPLNFSIVYTDHY